MSRYNQETDLALYTIAWHEDNKHITEVTTPRVIETGYRSPQLTLWTLGPDEWLLFKKLPDYAPRKKRTKLDVLQHTWSELSSQILALGPGGPLLLSGQGLLGPNMPFTTRRIRERGACVFFPLSVFR